MNTLIFFGRPRKRFAFKTASQFTGSMTLFPKFANTLGTMMRSGEKTGNVCETLKTAR